MKRVFWTWLAGMGIMAVTSAVSADQRIIVLGSKEDGGDYAQITVHTPGRPIAQAYRSQLQGSAGASFRLDREAFNELIAGASRAHNIDPDLVRAIVHAESGFNPRAQSPKNAMGLMQLIPSTAKRFGVDDPFNPAQNIAGGTRYLRELLNLFNGNVVLAVAGYNAGEGAVQKYGGIPPYQETQEYVRRVAKLYKGYKDARAPQAVAWAGGQ